MKGDAMVSEQHERNADNTKDMLLLIGGVIAVGVGLYLGYKAGYQSHTNKIINLLDKAHDELNCAGLGSELNVVLAGTPSKKIYTVMTSTYSPRFDSALNGSVHKL